MAGEANQPGPSYPSGEPSIYLLYSILLTKYLFPASEPAVNEHGMAELHTALAITYFFFSTLTYPHLSFF